MRKRLIIIVLIITGVSSLFAGVNTYVSGKSGNNISGTIKIEDPDYACSYSSCTSGIKFVKTRFITKLWYEDVLRENRANWTATVNYDITYYTNTFPSNIYTISGKTLTIDYKTAGNYTDIDYELFLKPGEMIVKAEVTINSFTNTGLTTIPNDIRFDLELETEKIFPISKWNNPLIQQHTTYLAKNAIVNHRHHPTKNELELYWNFVEGAESYDVEWIFIDCGSAPFSSDTAYDFANATRINTSQNHYNLSLAYPRGTFLFRARPVSPHVKTWHNGKGSWGTAGSGNLSPTLTYQVKIHPTGGAETSVQAFSFEGMDPTKNWQYSVTYAEEGKRKEVVQYYDGAMYNRQSVTVSNSNNKAIIGQTLYDFVGRPAVNVMPTPLTSTGIHYYDNRGAADVARNSALTAGANPLSHEILSKNTQVTNDNYSFHDFDQKGVTAGALPTTGLMSSLHSKGAANYYSQHNTETGINSDYIPDAQELPFTRTIYSADGTNRVLRQSGVGATHKIGNKDTRYFYATPGSSELDRLFGNEVGAVVNYKKNIVVDPNGQASTSYIDGKGRTIATGLIGHSDSSSHLLDIDTKPALMPILTDSLNHSNRQIGDSILSSTKAIFIQAAGNYFFDYEIDSSTFIDCFTGDCQYNLKIYILDEATGLKVALTPLLGITTITDSVIRESIDASGKHTLKFSAYMPSMGTYQVVKELTVKQNHADSLTAAFINYHTNNPNTCYDFIPPPLVTSCDSCEYNCITSYSSADPFTHDLTFYDTSGNPIAKFVYDPDPLVLDYPKLILSGTTQPIPDTLLGSTSSTDWNTFYDNFIKPCIDQCNQPEISNCELQYEQLKADMSPGGQYFDNHVNPTNPNGWLTSSSNPNLAPNFISGGTQSTWINVRANWNPNWEDQTVQEHPEFCLFKKHCCYTPPNLVSSSCPIVIEIEQSGNGCCESLAFDVSNALSGIPSYSDFNRTGNPTTARTLRAIAYQVDNIVSPNQTYISTDIDFNYYHGPSGIIGNGAGQITADDFYNQQMDYFMALAIDSLIRRDSAEGCYYLPTNSTVFISKEGFDVRYPNFNDYKNKVFSNPQAASDSMCIVTCEQSVTQWLADFKCMDTLSAQDSLNLVNELIAVCSSSCTNNGAPNDTTSVGVPTSLAGSATTFEQVINSYRTKYRLNSGACPTPKFPSENNCNCDNVFDFALNNTPYQRYSLPLNYLNIYIQNSIALDSLLNDLTGWGLNDDYGNAYKACMYNTAYNFNDLPDLLKCKPDSTISYIPLNEDSICVAKINEHNYNSAKAVYDADLLQKAQAWRADLVAHCIDNAKKTEKFHYQYELLEYHYTLYFYDQADNLIKTVPPEGIYQKNPVSKATVYNSVDSINLDTVYAYRISSGPTFQHPNYAMWTNYKYNSLNQLIEQTTPDGGASHFYYDKLGRLIASQNNEQEDRDAYSYTVFDNLGRIAEVGELISTTQLTDKIARSKTGNTATDWTMWFSNTTGNRTQIVKTYYNTKIPAYTYTTQHNLRNRIAAVTYDKNGDGTYESASHYDYDINGNVQTLVQENIELPAGYQFKTIDYEYDLVSGNVNQVDYQKEKKDEQFSHQYEYDADNRLTVAYTSKNEVIWEKESKNFYYGHGPLARTETGDKQVQAQDYAYTIQGWLKTINSSTNERANDLGEDAKIGTLNYNFAQDAYGFSLHYFSGDYKATGSGANPNVIATSNNVSFDNDSKDLYNGNISKMIVGLTDNLQEKVTVLGNAYRYDKLNRIKQYTAYINPNNDNARTDNHFGSVTASGAYNSSYVYDGNGNIDSLHRNGTHANKDMDEFSYIYDLNASNYKTDNKLYQVKDAKTSVYGDDLDSQPTSNYAYDSIGRLIKDSAEGILSIQWNVANKITSITKTAGHTINFSYDPMGNRLSKTDINPGITNTSFYVRDAQGNVMATYTREQEPAKSKDLFKLNEFHIYGSSRLGIKKEELALSGSVGSSGSLVFNKNTSDYAAIPHDNSYDLALADFTVEAWIKASSIQGSYPMILSNRASQSTTDPGFFISLNPQGYLKLQMRGQNIANSTGPNLRDDSWHHIAVVRQGSNVYYYIDGTLNGSNLGGALSITNSHSLWLGKDNGGYPFNGNISNVRFWNTARSQSQISANKNIELSGSEVGLIGLWGLKEGTGQAIADKTANANHGHLGSNSSANSNDPNWDASSPPVTATSLDLSYRRLGTKRYELANHLGNVLEVISDRRLVKTEVKYHAKFNGAGQYINTGTSNRGITDEVTVQFHIKTTVNSNSGQAILSDYGSPSVYGGYFIYLLNGKIEVHGRNSSNGYHVSGTGGTKLVSDGIWHDVSVVISSSDDWQVYIDGVLNESINFGSSISNLTNSVPLQIGRFGSSTYLFSGELKEVSIWNRAKTSTEISSSVQSTYYGGETNLVAYFKLNEQSGGYLDKVTGNTFTSPSTPSTVASSSVYYTADVISYSDYYPFGMLMPNRHGDNGEVYRYAFNGKEQDPETMGQGNIYDYGFRIYNPRIAKFLSVDPLSAAFPWYTPYQFAGNMPIIAIDLDGLEEYTVVYYEKNGNLTGYSVRFNGSSAPQVRDDQLKAYKSKMKSSVSNYNNNKSKKPYKKLKRGKKRPKNQRRKPIEKYRTDAENATANYDAELAKVNAANERLEENWKGKAVVLTIEENAPYSKEQMFSKLMSINPLVTVQDNSSDIRDYQSISPESGGIIDASAPTVVGFKKGVSNYDASDDAKNKVMMVGIVMQPLKDQFATSSSVLSSEAKAVLMDNVKILVHNRESKVNIVGHTDNVGSASANSALSQERADAVSEFLISNGVNADQIESSTGAGETQPIGSNDTAGGRASNRRVEIKMSK